MSDKKIKPDVSETKTHDGNDNDKQQKDNYDKIAIQKCKQINVEQNDCTEIESVDMKSINKNEMENQKNDNLNIDNEKKKDISDSNVAAYLKSDLIRLDAQDVIGLEKKAVILSKYTEIDMTGQSGKNVKSTKVSRYSQKRLRIPYMREPVMVQFMGSEDLPEGKYLMEPYEPQISNHMVKIMWAVLSVMNFVSGCIIMTLHISDAKRTMGDNAGVLAFFSFVLMMALIITTMCYHGMRTKYAIFGVIIAVVVLRSLFGAALTLALPTPLLVYAYFTMFSMDLLAISLGCCNYNYMLISLFFILLGVGIFLSYFIWAVLENVFMKDDSFMWFYRSGFKTLGFSTGYSFYMTVLSIFQLRFLLKGEWIELAEDDYFFGGYLLYAAPYDFPLRMLRKYGAFKCCDPGDGDEEEK